MKKLIIILTVVTISLNVNAQSKSSGGGGTPIDSSKLNSIKAVDSASMPLLSINDINRYLQTLESQLSVTQYKEFLNIFNYMIATKQKELQQPKKK